MQQHAETPLSSSSDALVYLFCDTQVAQKFMGFRKIKCYYLRSAPDSSKRKMDNIVKALILVISKVPKRFSRKLLFNLVNIGPEFAVFKSNRFWKHGPWKKTVSFRSYAQEHQNRTYIKQRHLKSKKHKKKLRKLARIECVICKTFSFSYQLSMTWRNVMLHTSAASMPYYWVDASLSVSLPMFSAERRDRLMNMLTAATKIKSVGTDITDKVPVCANCMYHVAPRRLEKVLKKVCQIKSK
jgi:hypothetical protein